MNIWWVNYTALPPTEAGGTRHYSLARELRGRGHDVTVIASSFHYVDRSEIRLAGDQSFRFENVDGVPFLWLKTPGYQKKQAARVWSWVVFGWRLWRGTGLSELSPPDIVIGSSPYPFAALAAERVARRYGAPFAFEVRDLWPQTLIDLGDHSRYHPFIALLSMIERYLYRRSNLIINLLPDADQYMVERGAQPGRIVWIPNGVDLSMVPDPQPPADDGVFTAMYAGAHGLANGLDVLLDAARLLERNGWRSDRLRIRLVGSGPEKARLQERARRENIENVEFHAPVPKSQIYEVLAEADAFFMHLRDSPVFRWGVSPNKLFDYMVSARPVVFAVGSTVNPVGESGCGLTISPEDPEALADAMEHLMELSAAERWEMGQRGRRYVEEQHALSRLAANLEDCLADAATSSA